jgi:hypothetical protein
MTTETPDRDLTEEEKKLVAKLSENEIQEIDQALFSFADNKYNRKVSRIVGSVMSSLPNRVNGIPDVFYSQRVARLVQQGLLVAEGNLRYMRYSEVRLP